MGRVSKPGYAFKIRVTYISWVWIPDIILSYFHSQGWSHVVQQDFLYESVKFKIRFAEYRWCKCTLDQIVLHCQEPWIFMWDIPTKNVDVIHPQNTNSLSVCHRIIYSWLQMLQSYYLRQWGKNEWSCQKKCYLVCTKNKSVIQEQLWGWSSVSNRTKQAGWKAKPAPNCWHCSHLQSCRKHQPDGFLPSS